MIQKLGNGEEGSPDFLAGASGHCQRLRKHGESPEDFRNAEQVSGGELANTQRRRKIWSKADARQNQFLNHVVYKALNLSPVDRGLGPYIENAYQVKFHARLPRKTSRRAG